MFCIKTIKKLWKKKDALESYNPEVFESVSSGLKYLYTKKLKPLEEAYQFHDLHSPPLQDGDFDSKPLLLVVGQYSVGKTSFIKYLLDRGYPGMRIGPEPTTDCFTAIMHADADLRTGEFEEGIIPGDVVVADSTKPFTALSSIGNVFLSRLQCSMLKHEVLRSVTIIDTPGILSGEKQKLNRGYSFSKVGQQF